MEAIDRALYWLYRTWPNYRLSIHIVCCLHDLNHVTKYQYQVYIYIYMHFYLYIIRGKKKWFPAQGKNENLT